MLYDYILKAKVRSIFIIYQEKKDNKLNTTGRLIENKASDILSEH